MKTYDCFQFFNELDILEIRLNELYSQVDYFVIVEAEASHQYKRKPLFVVKIIAFSLILFFIFEESSAF